jgi:hypothetical protein
MATVDLMNSATMTWVPTSVSLSSPRSFVAASSAGPIVVVAGGANGAATSVVDMFDADDNFARTTISLTEARIQVGLAALDSRYVLAAGGRYGGQHTNSWSGTVELIDTWTRAIVDSRKLVVAPLAYSAAVSLGNRSVAFFGGYGSQGWKSTSELFRSEATPVVFGDLSCRSAASSPGPAQGGASKGTTAALTPVSFGSGSFSTSSSSLWWIAIVVLSFVSLALAKFPGVRHEGDATEEMERMPLDLAFAKFPETEFESTKEDDGGR